MFIVKVRGEMAVQPAVTAIQFHYNAMLTRTKCNHFRTS